MYVCPHCVTYLSVNDPSMTIEASCGVVSVKRKKDHSGPEKPDLGVVVTSRPIHKELRWISSVECSPRVWVSSLVERGREEEWWQVGIEGRVR